LGINSKTPRSRPDSGEDVLKPVRYPRWEESGTGLIIVDLDSHLLPSLN
jgi:hypothetical protein